MMMITAMAHMPAQSMVNCAVKSIRPTGRVLLSVERVSWLASAYSFHEVRKAKMPALAMPDLASGNSIFQNACHGVQPSIWAASFRSFGHLAEETFGQPDGEGHVDRGIDQDHPELGVDDADAATR